MSDPSNLRFESLTIEGFRGFRTRQTIELSASAVILSGPNGTGKTSVFDALQWLLLGRLERLEPMRTRRNDEHIVNQYSLPGQAEVQALVSLQGELVTLRRVGDYSDSLLEIERDGETLRGESAIEQLEGILKPGEGVPLSSAMLTSGILQQDVMRSVLEAKPQDRYEHLTGLMRLGVIEEFQVAVDLHLKRVEQESSEARASLDEVERSISALTLELNEIERLAGARPSARAVKARLARLIDDLADLVTWNGAVDDLTSDGALTLLGETAALRAALTEFHQALTQVDTELALLPEVSDDDLSELEAAVESLEAAAVEAREVRAVAQEKRDAIRSSTARLTELATVAIPLLSGACPVCGQAIDPEDVARQLQAASEDVSDLMNADRELEQAQKRLDDILEAHAEADSAVKDRLRRRAQRERLEKRRLEVLSNLQDLAQSDGALTVTRTFVQDLIAGNSGIADLRGGQLEGELQQLASVLEGTEKPRAETIRRDLERLEKSRRDRRSRLETASSRSVRVKQLSRASIAARVDVISQRFAALEPLVTDIYQRLDPHPAFKSLLFEHQIYKNKGRTVARVRDEVEDVLSDPLLVFSTAQANIAALAFFLAMGWAAADGCLPFVLLDDPLQSMDDVNVLGFADLCRYIRQDRQLIISTHEKRFADLLERKLTPRVGSDSTLVHRFGAWDRSGPMFTTQRIAARADDGASRLLSAS